ncbi:MAG: PQQ-binding-like beta-propeller repeat protein [Gammaproteobacteria bacterium]
MSKVTNFSMPKIGVSLITALVMGASSITVSHAADNPGDWPKYHRLDNGWRYSPLDQVNKSNVKDLKVSWIHQVGNIANGMQATPIVLDGVIYSVGPDNNVFAINGETGETIWHYQPELDPIVEEVFYTNASRGVTVGHGNVYLGTLDGRFIALDQNTGEVVWENQIITTQREDFGILFSSPPQLCKGILYSGSTGGDQAQLGRVFAADAKTGKTAWIWYTLEDAEKHWPGKSREVGGGGAWLPGQCDDESGTIYIGTSNAAPDFYTPGREGTNKWAASYVALDAKTGTVKFGHQEIPNDVYDYDSAYEGVFFEKDGKEYIAHLNKGGFVFVYNKADLSIANVWKFAEHVNYVDTIDPKTGKLVGRITPEEGKEITICPYLLGARSWNHGAYNPITGLWYNNAQEACNTVVPAPTDPDSQSSVAALSLGVSAITAVAPPGTAKATARLDARDPMTGKPKWSINYDMPGYGSVMTTKGGLVFNGDPYGYVYAYDADTGKTLWKFNTGSGIRGGIVSYSAGGKQYILVPSGWGSLAPGFAASAYPGIDKLPGGASLVAFELK